MLRTLFTLLFAAGVTLLATNDAKALFVTEQATIDVDSSDVVGAPPPPITQFITGFTAAGRLLTNTYGVDALGRPLVRTVGAIRITDIQTKDGSTFGGITGPGNNPDRLVVVFAIDGVVIDPTVALALFTSGGAAVYEQSGVFNSLDPTTWFEDITAPIYSLKLKPQEAATAGQGSQIADVPAAVMNTSAVNAATGAQNQGRFLFEEFEDPTDRFAAIGTQDEFIDVTTFSGGTFVSESIFSTTDQEVDTDLTLADLSAAEQAVLQDIAELVGMLSDLTGAGDFFADFNSGTFLDWDPAGAFPGDFTGDTGSEFHPGNQVIVPEPTSLALLSVGSILGAFGLGGRRRRRRDGVEA